MHIQKTNQFEMKSVIESQNTLSLYHQKLQEFKSLKNSSKKTQSKLEQILTNLFRIQVTNTDIKSQIILLKHELETNQTTKKDLSIELQKGYQNQIKVISDLKIKKQQIEDQMIRKLVHNKITVQKLNQKFQQLTKNTGRQQENTVLSQGLNNEQIQKTKRQVSKLEQEIKTVHEQTSKHQANHNIKLKQIVQEHNLRLLTYKNQQITLGSLIDATLTRIDEERRENQKQLGILKAELVTSVQYPKPKQQQIQLDRQMSIVIQKIKTLKQKRTDFQIERKELENQQLQLSDNKQKLNQKQWESQQEMERMEQRVQQIKKQNEAKFQQLAGLQKHLQQVVSSNNSIQQQIFRLQNSEYNEAIKAAPNNQQDRIVKRSIQQLFGRLISVKINNSNYQETRNKLSQLRQFNSKLQLNHHEKVKKQQAAYNQQFKYSSMVNACECKNSEQQINQSLLESQNNCSDGFSKGWGQKIYQLHLFIIITLAGLLFISFMDYF